MKNPNLKLLHPLNHRHQHQGRHSICLRRLSRQATIPRITSPTLSSSHLRTCSTGITLCIMHTQAAEALCLVGTQNQIIRHRHPLILQAMLRRIHFNSNHRSTDMVLILQTVATLNTCQTASLTWVHQLPQDTIRAKRTS